MVLDTSSSQDASTHQIWDSYLKQYKRYVPDTIILENRSEVKVTDTLPFKDAITHQIWNYFIKEYKRYAPDIIILKTRSEVKVTVTQKWHVRLPHPKMHLHTKFEIPTSNNMGDMKQTQ